MTTRILLKVPRFSKNVWPFSPDEGRIAAIWLGVSLVAAAAVLVLEAL